MFFGAVSLTTLLALFMGGGAVVAAGGVFLAGCGFYYNNPPLGLSITAGALLLAGLIGARGGFEYGAAQEAPMLRPNG